MSSLNNFFCIVLLAVKLSLRYLHFVTKAIAKDVLDDTTHLRDGVAMVPAIKTWTLCRNFLLAGNTIPPCRDLLSWIALSQEHRVAVGNDLLQDAGESKRVRRTLSRRVEKRVSTIQDVASPASPIDNTYLYDSTPTVSDINSCTIPQLRNGTKLRCGQT
ncbi:hypothetical protein EDD18DRAFT_1110032 [Armillaria luteobubalina]|uniref:Uncharacterized protein n=1 Tax=Armillaria luteobubalina TaxID=153913 RepID=A0AA39PSF6_9AGAR|nr:hypothetical protein EDD18DRAFT_1110032 [Armillaria luteobubalina]